MLQQCSHEDYIFCFIGDHIELSAGAEEVRSFPICTVSKVIHSLLYNYERILPDAMECSLH